MPDGGTVGRHQRHVPRPTRSAALLLLIAAILELLGRLIKSDGVTIAGAAAIGAVISDAFLTPNVHFATVNRQSPRRMTAGIEATVRVVFAAPTGRRGARNPVVLIDETEAMPAGRVMTPRLNPGQRAVALRTATPVHRGYWSGPGRYTIEAFSPLGGFVRRCTATSNSTETWVHPTPARAYQLPDPTGGPAHGNPSAARAGAGTDFFGIREWRSGDPTSAVHWRASARRNHLVVMERERPAMISLLVVAGLASTGPDWETAVARTAATAVAAIKSGRTVTLVVGTSSTTATSSRQALDWFAELDAETALDQRTLDSSLRTAAGATLLWLSTTPAPGSVTTGARTAGVNVVSTAVLGSGPTR